MRLKKFHKYTCFALGMAGAVVALLGGALMMAGFGWASYAHMASFVLTGAMLLFLGAMEKGDAKRGLRTKLLVLFFLLVVSYMNLPQRLPPLDLLEIPVLPCLLALYRKKGDGPWIAGLAFLEVCYAGVRYLGLASLLGTQQQALVAAGAALALLAAARFLVLLRLYRRMKAEIGAQNEGAHSLH